MTHGSKEGIASLVDEMTAKLSKARSLSDERGRKARKYSRVFFAMSLVQAALMVAGMWKGDWLDVMIVILPFIVVSVLVGMALRSYSKEQEAHSSACMEMCSALRVVRELVRAAGIG